MSDDSPFLSRWARRKAQARKGPVADEAAAPVPPPPAAGAALPPATAAADAIAESVADAGAAAGADAGAEPQPLPTLDDVARLTHDSDYAPFVARGVDPGVRNSALKKLFSDPRFNLMDGLDTYIDDYGKPDPLPPGMLRQLVQSQGLGLFAEDDAEPARLKALNRPLAQPPADPRPADPLPPAATRAIRDEDPDLRLQPNDAAGPAGADPGLGQHPGREH